MNRLTFFIVPLTIVIGLVTLMYSVNHLFDKVELELNSGKKNNTIIINNNDSINVFSKKKFIVEMSHFVTKKKNDIYKKKLILNTHPSIFKWIVFHSIILSLASGTIIFILVLIYNLRNEFNVNFKSKKILNKIFIPIIIIIICGAATYYLKSINDDRGNIMTGVDMMKYFNIIFENPKETTGFIRIPLTILGLIPLMGIVMINIATNLIFSNSSNNKEDLTEKYKTLKSYLNIFAFYTGLLVASTIIGIRLQRSMIAEQIQNIEKIYPNEFIYSYGIAYTLILAFFFIPTLMNLKYYKQKNNITLQKNDAKWWEIGEDTIGDIKLILSTILPLLTSLFQMFN